MTYDLTVIAKELRATADGEAYYGNALRVAKDLPFLTDVDRAVLDRWATGAQNSADRFDLQEIAIAIHRRSIEAIVFDKKVHVAPYTVEVSTKEARGHFEHDEFGDERGGGLWFQANEDGKLEIIDYDGRVCLPDRVIEALEQMDIIVPEEFL